MGKNDKQKLFVTVDSQPSEPGQSWLDVGQEAELLLDVYQDDDNIYITSTIAGVDPEDLDISVNHDLLTIRGHRTTTTEVDQSDYFYQECYWGSFSRSIILPMEIKTDQIAAEIKNGVLKIILPKLLRQRRIPVKIKD